MEELKIIEEMFKKNLELLKKKNADYAGDNDFFFNFVVSAEAAGIKTEQGMLVRIMDKVSRASNLIHKTPDVLDESLEDTLSDLVNYSALLYAFVYKRVAPISGSINSCNTYTGHNTGHYTGHFYPETTSDTVTIDPTDGE